MGEYINNWSLYCKHIIREHIIYYAHLTLFIPIICTITPHLPFYAGERLDIDDGRLSKSEEMQQQTAKPTSSLERQSQIHNMMMENEETIISTIQIINMECTYYSSRESFII